MRKELSFVAESNLFAMGVTGRNDPRQALPSRYWMPGIATRVLRARLIIEEALETVKALGVMIKPRYTRSLVAGEDVIISEIDDLVFAESGATDLDLAEIIDGCCDTIYVCAGTLCAVGAPDVPHLMEVCRRNNAKFPGGVATINAETGKYEKPEGWTGPDHDALIASISIDLAEEARMLVRDSDINGGI